MIILTDFLWFTDYAIFVALAAYNRHPRKSYTTQYAAILQISFSSLIILYIWARTPGKTASWESGQARVFFRSYSWQAILMRKPDFDSESTVTISAFRKYGVKHR